MTVLYNLQNFPTGLTNLRSSYGSITTSGTGKIQTTHPMIGKKFDVTLDGTQKLIKVPVKVNSGHVGIMLGRKTGSTSLGTTETTPLTTNAVNTADRKFHNPVKNEDFYLSIYSDWYDSTVDPVYGLLGSLENPARRCKVGYKLNPGDTPTLIKQFPDSDRTFVMKYDVTPSGRLLLLVIQRYGASAAADPDSPYTVDGRLDDRDTHFEDLKLIEVNLSNYTVLREQKLLDYTVTNQHNHALDFTESTDGKILVLTTQTPSFWPSAFKPDIMYSDADGWTFHKANSYTLNDEINIDEPQFAQVSSNEYLIVGRTDEGFVYKSIYNNSTKARTKFASMGIVANSNTNRIIRWQDGRLILSFTHNDTTSFLPRTLGTLLISGDGFQTYDEVFLQSYIADTSVAYGSSSYSTGVNDWALYLENSNLGLLGWNNSFTPKNFTKTMTIPTVRTGKSVSNTTGQVEELTIDTSQYPAGTYELQIFSLIEATGSFDLVGDITLEEVSTDITAPLITVSTSILIPTLGSVPVTPPTTTGQVATKTVYEIRQGTTPYIPIDLVDNDGADKTGVTNPFVYYSKNAGSVQEVTTLDWVETNATLMPGSYWLKIAEVISDSIGFVQLNVSVEGCKLVKVILRVVADEGGVSFELGGERVIETGSAIVNNAVVTQSQSSTTFEVSSKDTVISVNNISDSTKFETS